MHPHSHTSRPRRISGFTLIELLTVIAIIGILAAILIPTVSKVRSSAKKAACVSRLRQWSSINSLVQNDYRGYILLESKSEVHDKYITKGMMRAESEKTGISETAMAPWEAMTTCPTGINGGDNTVRGRQYCWVVPIGVTAKSTLAEQRQSLSLWGFQANYYYRPANAAAPARLLLMIEGRNSAVNPGSVGGIQSAMDTVRIMQVNDGYVRHGGLALALFLDGHVGALTPQDTSYSTSPEKLTTWLSLR